MPRNVEIKAKVEDLGKLRRKAEELSHTPGLLIKQCDTFFKVATGRLKLRETDGKSAQLIFYERPDSDGPKLSNYSISEINDPKGLKETLGLALGTIGEVEKERWLYLVEQARIHCDRVKSLGDFMELEVVLQDQQQLKEGEAVAKDLMRKLNIKEEDLLEGAYMDIILKGKPC